MTGGDGTPGAVTLALLRALHRPKFHPTQDWFEGEAFMHIPLPHLPTPPAPRLLTVAPHDRLPHAVELVAYYVLCPEHVIFRFYLWTRDCDHDGQRIYLGVNDRGLEIHRHLALSPRWRYPQWS